MKLADIKPRYRDAIEHADADQAVAWQKELAGKSLVWQNGVEDFKLEKLVIELDFNGRQTFAFSLFGTPRGLDALMHMNIMPAAELRIFLYTLEEAGLIARSDSPARGVLPLEVRTAKQATKDAHQKKQELLSNIQPFELVEEPERLKAQIRLVYANLKVKNHYQLLEVTEDATQDEIDAKHTAMLRIFHPDRVGAILNEEEDKEKFTKAAEIVFKRATKIYDELSDSQSRELYNASLKQVHIQNLSQEAKQVGEVLEIQENDPEKLMDLAHQMLAEKNYSAAEQYASRASTMSGRSLKSELVRLWVSYKNENTPKEERIKKAKRELRGLFAQTRDPQVTFQLALMAEQNGNPDEAIRFARMSLSVDEHHSQSLAVLARLAPGEHAEPGAHKDKTPPELSNKAIQSAGHSTGATGVFKVLFDHATKEVSISNLASQDKKTKGTSDKKSTQTTGEKKGLKDLFNKLKK